MTYDNSDGGLRKRVTTLSPHEFGDTLAALLPAFVRNVQHDAQEFFHAALDRMSKELVLDKMGKFGDPEAMQSLILNDSPVYEFFGGAYVNTVRAQ